MNQGKCTQGRQGYTPIQIHLPVQARSQGGGGGGGSGGGGRTTPQLPIPKILFHPLAILFHPLAILVHPLAILFHPWNMWMTSHGQCPRGGGACECPREGGVFQFFGGRMTSRGQCPRGGACECPRVGAFFKLMTSRGQCPRGGGVCLVFHPSKFRPPPHLAGWLRACCRLVKVRIEILISVLWVPPLLAFTWAVSPDCETLRDTGNSQDNDVLERQTFSVTMLDYVVLSLDNV